MIRAKCPFGEGEHIQSGYLLVAGISATDHFDRRERLRYHISTELKDRRVKLVFFLGLSSKSNINDKIQKESEFHEDIIQGHFLDTYRNLTRKTILMVTWINDYCNRSKFVLQMDDDMAINSTALRKSIETVVIPPKGVISGNCRHQLQPIRNNASKWYVPVEDYPESHYPAACLGPGYLLSGNSVPLLYAEIHNVPFFVLEDIYLTGFVRQKAGVETNDIQRFFCCDRNLKCSLHHA